ncbi:MAG: hypothetical protein IPO92_03430 [Saprospiraceae bacterium]|nr:hypothetical protein [Saprospiraceae bacterium]
MKPINLCIVFFLFPFLASGQITGKAYRDFNGDGMQQVGEPNRGNIIVKFYGNTALPGKDVLLATQTTAANGTYSYTPASYPVRIEFEIPSGFCNLSPTQDYSAGNGSTYGTAVQIAIGPSVHNFIISYPADFALNENPEAYTTCFVNGDPLVPGGSAGDSDAFVGMHYQDNGHGSNSGYYPSNPNGGPVGPPHEVVGLAKQVGSVWGVAISKQAKKIFTSAFLKRHAGMGPLGGGGIYMIDATDKSTSYNYGWLDFDADLGIATSNEAGVYTNALTAPGSNQVTFSPVIGSNSNRTLVGNKVLPSQDAAAWEQVGKVSFGDIDISEDGRYLYIVNLYDRKLYQIDLVDPFNPVKPTLADVGTKVKSFDIPDPCSGPEGEHMPFGIKVTRGKVFVGVVCNGQALNGTIVGTENDLNGNIFEFDVVTGLFNATPVLSYPLNYRSATPNKWVPWTPIFQSYFEGAGYPMISDIEFDGSGNMIIGMVDRRGHQAGWYNYDLNGSGSTAIAVVGDILRAVRSTSTANCTYSIQFSPEYYKDDKFHPEPINGGLAVHRTANSDNVLATYMDPVWIWSGGTMRFDNLTGLQIGNGYEIYFTGNVPAGPFGKAAGIGDIEVLGEVPLIEIGNVVWSDTDRDGIQDGNEPPIPGIIIELVNASGVVVGTSTTNANGGYYFNYANVVDSIGPAKQNILGPQPYTTYTIRIKSTQFNNGGVVGSALENYVMTSTDEVGTGLTDYSDNDASVIGGLAQLTAITGGPGENNHTFDFGLILCPQPGLGSSTTICDNSTAQIDLFSLLTGEDTGGTWTRESGSDGVFSAVNGTFTPQSGATTSIFKYTIGDGVICEIKSETVTININPITNAGVDGSIDGCEGGNTIIALNDIITGEQAGGTWSRLTGTGGVFDALAGTFALTSGTTTSTFLYTRTGIPPCIDDTSVATVNITGNCCVIDLISIQSIECLDNNTPKLMTDNRLKIGILANNQNILLTNYNVTVNGGTTISPSSGTYGVGTFFTLGAGTAGGGATFVITITDSTVAGCTNTVTVTDPGNCTQGSPPCEQINCGTATIQVYGN